MHFNVILAANLCFTVGIFVTFFFIFSSFLYVENWFRGKILKISLLSFKSFFYSRKNFMKPSHQGYPHRNFQEEIEFLNAIFPSK